MRLIYVPTLSRVSYRTGVDKNMVKMTKDVLRLWPGGERVGDERLFFAACRNGNLSFSFAYVLSDHHCGDILVLLLTGTLKDGEVLGAYDVIRFIEYNPLMFS